MNRCSFQVLTAVVIGLAAASSGLAKEYRVGPLETSSDGPSAPPGGTTAGSSNSIYTGLVNNSGSFYTLEPIPAPHSDVVTFNGVEQQINDYVTLAGTPVQGQRRFVTESSSANGDGSTTDTFSIRCVDAVGSPADLWPQGLTVGGQALPNGGAGLGLALDAALGGFHPVVLNPNTTITGLTVEVVSDGVSSGQIPLALSTFIQPSPSNWNGQLGLTFFDGANDAAIDSQITMRITSVSAPEPAGVGLLAFGGIALRRLRR